MSELAIFCVVAIVVLGLLIWGTKNPWIWWILCVMATGTGAGLLVWGLLIYGQEEEALICTPAGIIGAGAGCLAGSIVLFVAAIFGSCCRRR
jgi:hypothetical protein